MSIVRSLIHFKFDIFDSLSSPVADSTLLNLFAQKYTSRKIDESSISGPHNFVIHSTIFVIKVRLLYLS